MNFVPRFGLNLRLGGKLLLLNGVLFAVVMGSLFFVRLQVVATGDAVARQTSLLEKLGAVNSVERSFNEMRYWLVDLELTWFEGSEDKADDAEAKLRAHLSEMAIFAPEQVAAITPSIDDIVSLSYDAVDAFIEGSRAQGINTVEQVRVKIPS